jgi:hypothetical protein
MFCNVEFVKQHELPSAMFRNDAYEPFWFRHLLFVPRYSTHLNRITSFSAEIKNMRLTYNVSSGRVKLQNSIHKYSDGWNLRNLKLKEYVDTVEELSDATGIQWLDANFKSAEVGTTFRSKTNLLNSNICYKNQPFITAMSNGSTCLQKKFNTTAWKSSLYNKYLETIAKCKDAYILESVLPDLLRFELQLSHRYMHQLHKVTESQLVYDFLDIKNLNKIKPKLTKIVKNITIENGYDYSKIINCAECIKLLAIGKDPELYEKYKTEHPDGFKKQRKKIKELQAITGIRPVVNLVDVFNSAWEDFVN